MKTTTEAESGTSEDALSRTEIGWVEEVGGWQSGLGEANSTLLDDDKHVCGVASPEQTEAEASLVEYVRDEVR